MSLEIIELENDGILNGRCNMKYTLIYKATNVTKFVHNWNIITFDRSLFESVSNTVCATGQCEQRPLEVGECVIYSNKEKNVIYPGTVIAKNANDTYTIDVTLLDQRLHTNNNNSDSLFQEDLGKNLIGEHLYELTLTKIPNVERVRLKTVNHIIKFIESGNKTTLYYTNFLNMAELTWGRLVSNTMFINLGAQTYLPFWCEPTKGFIAAPTIMTQLPEISGKTFIHAWTHYMNWCQDLHTFIETAEEAHAAYMYTFLKLELYGLGDQVAEFCNDHRKHINVEQDKLLRILGKQGMGTNGVVTNVPNGVVPNGVVPNPPAIYMKKIVYDQLRINQSETDKYFYGKLYQIHSKDDTQRMLAAAKRVTQKIINAQKFPFVSISVNGNTQFDNESDFTNWLRGKTNVLLLTNRTDIDTLLPGFNASSSVMSPEIPYCTVYKSQDGLQSVCITDIFQTENCQDILKSAKQWWNDKQLYYINYGKNYDSLSINKPIVKFDNRDTICGLRQTGLKRGGKLQNDEDIDYDYEQTGGENTYTNVVCLDATTKYIIINPTQPEDTTRYTIIDWWTNDTSTFNKIKFENKHITGEVLQQICKDAYLAMTRYYNLTELNFDALYNALSQKFKIIFIESSNQEDEQNTGKQTITVGIKTYIDNLLKVHETKLRETTDDFASNFIFVFRTKNTQISRYDVIDPTTYSKHFTCYFGYLQLKRMEIQNNELLFVSPFSGKTTHKIPFNNMQPVHGGSGKAPSGKAPSGKAQQKPIVAALKPVYPQKCNKTLLFNKIEDFETLLECLNQVLANRMDFNISEKQSINVNDILTATTLKETPKKNFYTTLKTNIENMVKPFITNKNYVLIIDGIKITNIGKNFDVSNLLKMPLTTIIKLTESIIENYNEAKQTQPSIVEQQLEQTPEPVDDLSTQMHIQITFTVCQIFPDIILEQASGFTNPRREGIIISNKANCFHKAYIKSITPISDTSAQISKCNSVLINVENIYTSASALYALKNNGYRLVKLVDDREHAYFIENPKGFVKQPTRQSIKNVKNQVTQKVTEYKLGENVAVNSILLEDIIELNPLIQKLTNENADLDIAFLAKNPDATDLEHMAILRNGISYQTP